MYNLEQGSELVRLARDTVAKSFKERKLGLRKTKDAAMNEEHGVFVTIKRQDDDSLRGCIGHVAPMRLYESLQQAAIAAAFKDPRFDKLREEELDFVIFEVSVMSEPMLVPGENLLEWKKNIEVGRDGLLISNGGYSGLLLPQVPVEQKWGVDEYLNNLCRKAGMDETFLSDEDTKLWVFTCQVFKEEEPNGAVISI